MVIVRLEDPGGVEPLARGLKARCPTVSGLNAPGPWHELAAASRPGLIMVVMVISCLFDGSPARYRTAVFRLSAGCSAIELRERCWCFVADSNRGSPACRAGALAAKLTKRSGARSRTRTWECRRVMTDALAAWRSEQSLVHPGGLEPPCLAAAASEAAASAVSPRVHCRGRIDGAATVDRTLTFRLTKAVPCHWTTAAMVLAGGLEPPASRLRGECSAR